MPYHFLTFSTNLPFNSELGCSTVGSCSFDAGSAFSSTSWRNLDSNYGLSYLCNFKPSIS